MFSKPPTKTGQEKSSSKRDLPALSGPDGPAARKTPKVASLVAENMTLEGSINGEGELQVDGVVRGDVRIGHLTIGDTGHVEGAIHAETIEIRGRVIGAVTAKLVRLYGTAYVDGDITHEQLSIEPGAFFQGRSMKFQRPSAASATMGANGATPAGMNGATPLAPAMAAGGPKH